MPLDWRSGELAEGLRCYRDEKFWHAHEHWESVWLGLEEPEKSFLRALIQTTAAFHHLQKGNRVGARSLLQRALQRMETCPTTFCGIDCGALRDEASAWRRALESGEGAQPAEFPNIRPID